MNPKKELLWSPWVQPKTKPQIRIRAGKWGARTLEDVAHCWWCPDSFGGFRFAGQGY